MSRYVILAQSEASASALSGWLSLMGDELQTSDPRWIVWDRPASSGADAVDAYETMVSLIEIATQGDLSTPQLNTNVVLVDMVHPLRLNAVTDGGDWSHLIAMLILTFPEIRWVFGHCTDAQVPKDSAWNSTVANHNLSSLLTCPRRDPLLDPSGLREWVRSRTNVGLQSSKNDLQLSKREKLAIAIDEEKPYAYLHGYTAYRFGCRADVVTSWELMKDRLGGTSETSDKSKNQPHDYWLLLEDMSLNFPDRETSLHLLRLKERATRCFKLLPDNETSKHRVLVTTGQERPGDTALAENLEYLGEKSNGDGGVVFKPTSGIFDLWAESGLLFEQLGRRGNAPNFCWPPPVPQQMQEATGHGAPGKLTLIAEHMIRRAQSVANSAKTVAEAVLGAVLATDALELTGGRTPTTAVEALTLKHRFEVMAECQFSGVEYHIWVQPRLDEIVVEMTAISQWFHSGHQKKAALNAEMHILNQLVSIFRERNRFDEEQICMNRARHLHNTLWMRQRPIRYVFWPLLRYLEILLSSFSVFVTALLVWVLMLSLLFWWAGHSGWEYGIADAVTSFFSIGGPVHQDDGIAVKGWRHVIVAAAAILSGFIHLGVFISHLYSLAMRK